MIVVEHDEGTMRAADYLVDLGPGPANTVAAWSRPARRSAVSANPDSLTGAYTVGSEQIAVPESRRSWGRP